MMVQTNDTIETLVRSEMSVTRLRLLYSHRGIDFKNEKNDYHLNE